MAGTLPEIRSNVVRRVPAGAIRTHYARTAALTAIALASVLLAPLEGRTALGAQSNHSTGLDAAGAVQTTGGTDDADWTINLQAPGVVAAPSFAQGSADWYGGWPANDSASG